MVFITLANDQDFQNLNVGFLTGLAADERQRRGKISQDFRMAHIHVMELRDLKRLATVTKLTTEVPQKTHRLIQNFALRLLRRSKKTLTLGVRYAARFGTLPPGVRTAGVRRFLPGPGR